MPRHEKAESSVFNHYVALGSSDESSGEDTEDDSNVFFEEISPDFEDTLGSFKTKNPENNRWQRRFIHTSGERSRFRKNVETVLVVHGWETEEKKQPMSLIVLGVKLDCHARNFRIQSARMWFTFFEDQKSGPSNNEGANPEVVAFAPFVEQEINNVTTERRQVSNSIKAYMGAQQILSIGLEGSTTVTSSYVRQHFDRGTADYLVRNDRVYGVNWFCEQNNLTGYGLSPHFHLAVLLKRNHTKADNKPIPFSSVFDMRIEAGFIHDIKDGVRRAFRLGKSEDEAVYYDPRMNVQKGYGGERLMAHVEQNNLGKLMAREGLNKVLDPEGVFAGLKPMAPSSARLN